jgi:hypothetical protein
MYRVTVKGTGQLNGPVKINKTVEYDDHVMANKFTGADRYIVMEEFVRVNYPGVKVNPRDLAANVVVVDEKKSNDSSIKDYNIEKTRSPRNNSKKKESVLKSFIAGTTVSSVIDSLNNRPSPEEEREEREREKEEEREMRKEEAAKKSKAKIVRNKIYNEAESVLNFDFSDNQSEIKRDLDKLLISLVAINSLKFSECSNIHHNQLIQKFKVGLMRLKSIGESEKTYDYYKRRYWQIRVKRVFFKIFNSEE